MPLKKVKINELVKYIHEQYPDSEDVSYQGMLSVLRKKVLDAKRAGVAALELELNLPEKNNDHFDNFMKLTPLSEMVAQIDAAIKGDVVSEKTTAAKNSAKTLSPNTVNKNFIKTTSSNTANKALSKQKSLTPTLQNKTHKPKPKLTSQPEPKRERIAEDHPNLSKSKPEPATKAPSTLSKPKSEAIDKEHSTLSKSKLENITEEPSSLPNLPKWLKFNFWIGKSNK